MRVERRDRVLRWLIDGDEFLVLDDPAPLAGPGHDRFGFSSWDSDLFFDDLRSWTAGRQPCSAAPLTGGGGGLPGGGLPPLPQARESWKAVPATARMAAAARMAVGWARSARPGTVPRRAPAAPTAHGQRSDPGGDGGGHRTGRQHPQESAQERACRQHLELPFGRREEAGQEGTGKRARESRKHLGHDRGHGPRHRRRGHGERRDRNSQGRAGGFAQE